jgi:hypothetical protein
VAKAWRLGFGVKMIKTLKITSILIAISAIGFIAFLVVFGLRGDRKIAEFLNFPGAIDKFRKLAKAATEDQDQISPLVKQAKAFALRINPPPPPKPIKRTPKKQVAKKTTPASPKPKAVVRAKFNLLATCRYEQQPQRSLALLDIPAKGPKWYHQGDKVGHLTIQEVKDGSIVCSGGQELFTPPSKKIKTLLKEDLVSLSGPQPTTTAPLKATEEQTLITGPAALSQETQPVTTPVPDKPLRQTQTRKVFSVKPGTDAQNRRRIRRLPDRKSQELLAPAEPSPEEMKETLTESISTIREMMSRSSSSLSEEEGKAELKVWEQLLKTLEKDRDEIENTPDQEKPKSEPVKQNK